MTNTEKIFKGVELIRQYDPDAEFAVGDDTIFFGAYETSSNQMSEDQLSYMEEWGWFEQCDSWAIYV
jgi:hypothetical protein